MSRAMSHPIEAAEHRIGRARTAGTLACLVGIGGTYWAARHAWSMLHEPAGGSESVATCAFALAIAVVCGWLTALTALATAALDDVGCHSNPTELHDRLVRRIAATLLVVAGGTGVALTQSPMSQVSVTRLNPPTPTMTTAGTEVDLAASARSIRPARSADAAPDPSFAGSQWLPGPPPSTTPSDGSLLTGAPRTVAPLTEIVVRQGDSLWSMVSRYLGPDADPARVCTEVRRWYDANRRLIGSDPDLLQPGQILHAPAESQ